MNYDDLFLFLFPFMALKTPELSIQYYNSTYYYYYLILLYCLLDVTKLKT